MWLFKLFLLLSLIASWLPIEGESKDIYSQNFGQEYQSEEAEEEAENEELAA